MALRIVIIAVIIAVCSAQNCSTLNLSYDDYGDGSTPRSHPPPGSINTQASTPSTTVSAICPQLNGQTQCCADNFFVNARMNLIGDLRDGLNRQTRPRIVLFHTIATELIDYFMNTFASDIAKNFANTTSPPSIPLNNNPRMDNYNISLVVYQLWNSLLDAIERSGPRFDNTCVNRQAVLVLAANQQAVRSMIKDLAVVRNITAVFNFIDHYVINATLNIISMVPPNNQCLNALLRLRCAKCQRSIPLLCRNVCGAVARGCYAPYVAVLNPQFNILWNVSSQLAQALVNALSDFFMQQRTIRMALIDALKTSCSITVPSNLSVVEPQGLGNQFMSKVQMIQNTGLLSYDPSDGPVICNSSSITARQSCWNGTMQVANDIQQFTVDSIKGQAQNPVFPFDEIELAQGAQSIGTPVASLLSSPDIAVAISGVDITIPQDQTTPTSVTTTNGSVGAHAVSLSLLVLLFVFTSILSL